MEAKSILMSKTLWANLLGLGATLAGLLPEQYSAPVMAVVNILLRMVTSQPVTLLGGTQTPLLGGKG
jgi:hypothetical protein